ncbi:hypothetical protein DSM100238_1354 [Bifidobacterium apri]|uniref:Uncharacterized protein n=1 Tax=Bifidobacterium apri TaxID=1769423 RepID=A0A6A2VDS2_9BIFI|nr:hypothetical protein DSM100238_1354 [Bifidobacterium apri]
MRWRFDGADIHSGDGIAYGVVVEVASGLRPCGSGVYRGRHNPCFDVRQTFSSDAFPRLSALDTCESTSESTLIDAIAYVPPMPAASAENRALCGLRQHGIECCACRGSQ